MSPPDSLTAVLKSHSHYLFLKDIGLGFVLSSLLDPEWVLSTLFDASLLTSEPPNPRLIFFAFFRDKSAPFWLESEGVP
jgi:hypothetical protein